MLYQKFNTCSDFATVILFALWEHIRGRGSPVSFCILRLSGTSRSLWSLRRSFGCLSKAMAFIHSHNLKHMDIKPRNILVRTSESNTDVIPTQGSFRIFVADFGIARSYKSVLESETDTLTSHTPAYAAPEVALQDKRGLSADIFSLGCVFMEIFAVLLSTKALNERERLQDASKTESGSVSYHCNLKWVVGWFRHVEQSFLSHHIEQFDAPQLYRAFVSHLPTLIDEEPNKRPKTQALAELASCLSCDECDSGPEPFEAAEITLPLLPPIID